MAVLTQDNTAPCNTLNRGRNWNFTWNNYTNDDIDTLKKYFDEDKYIIGKEVGENGTPHLQGCVSFKNARTFNSLKIKFPKCHWEITKNKFKIENYCKKENNFITNIGKSLNELYDDYMIATYKDIKWRSWQMEIFDIINFTPNDRRIINWYYDYYGNVGKTFLCRYIEWKYKVIIVNGKQNDVFNGIKNYLDTKKIFPEIILIDIPRTNEKYVCYGTIEKIKDGLFYSGKYEGGICRLLPVHVIVFANFKPEEEKMSIDRWNIKLIEE